MIHFVLWGDPRTKKNSMQLVGGKHPRLLPSKAYKEYWEDCQRQILSILPGVAPLIAFPVNVKCVYYMQTKRKIDLVNLIEGTLDILVDAGILEDDNSRIAAGHDGSRVEYDKDNPRVEIWIESMGERHEQSTAESGTETAALGGHDGGAEESGAV